MASLDQGGSGGGGDVTTDPVFDAKGDLIVGTGADAADNLTVGANDTILMADSAQTTGLKWVASASPAAVGTAADTGTADTFNRGDHVHAHEAAHINHDTTWAAKGDIIAGTANDTAAVLGVGTNGQMLTAQSGQSTGLQWATVFTHADYSVSGNLSTGTGVHRWYNDTGRTLTFTTIRASVGTAPTTQSIICDVNVDGTTIMTGTKVVIAAGANTGTQTTFSTTTIADGHYITFDIDQVGSGTVGANLTLTIWMSG